VIESNTQLISHPEWNLVMLSREESSRVDTKHLHVAGPVWYCKSQPIVQMKQVVLYHSDFARNVLLGVTKTDIEKVGAIDQYMKNNSIARYTHYPVGFRRRTPSDCKSIATPPYCNTGIAKMRRYILFNPYVYVFCEWCQFNHVIVRIVFLILGFMCVLVLVTTITRRRPSSDVIWR
jgi:hypothetical protein